MSEELFKSQNDARINKKAPDSPVCLFPGAELFYLSFQTASPSLQNQSSAMEHLIQINYCKSGQMAWKIENGQYLYLNPGNFSLHTMNTRGEAFVSFPTGQYSGLIFFIDPQKMRARPPELLKDMEVFRKTPQEKFCPDNTISFFAGNEQTENIFSAFYDQPEDLRLPYQRLKFLELLLYLARLEMTPQKQFTAYQSEQNEIIRKIHDRLIGQMNERLTIDELSKQYLINPTTLKNAFKAVYGTSIAAHIKEHRMEEAAKMLRESDSSIAEIAQAVGYDSQSRFASAFKASFGVLPREYRKTSCRIEKDSQNKAQNPCKKQTEDPRTQIF